MIFFNTDFLDKKYFKIICELMRKLDAYTNFNVNLYINEVDFTIEYGKRDLLNLEGNCITLKYKEIERINKEVLVRKIIDKICYEVEKCKK